MIAIVKASYNAAVTDALLEGCKQALQQNDTPYEVFEVPGAVETVGVCKQLLALNAHEAIIVMGAVIKGDTDHYEYVCDFVTTGISLLCTQSSIPIIFGILTTQTEELALERALPQKMNKGKEFADTALEMVGVYKRISTKFYK